MYTFLAAEFFIRYMSNKPFRKSKLSTAEPFIYPKLMTRRIFIMSLGIGFCTLCLFIRFVAPILYFYHFYFLFPGVLISESIILLLIETDPYTVWSSSQTAGWDVSSVQRSTLVRHLPSYRLSSNSTPSSPLLLPDVLDGAMITLAIYTFNFIHPGYFLAVDDDDDDSAKALDK